MLNGTTPPSRASGPDSVRLDAARGLVRDTLGAIRNIEQLLKSIRVGPRALASVIPDVHESCGPLRTAFRQLLGVIEEHRPDAARAIDQFVMPYVDQLERALARARSGPMNAKERLTLEEVITEVARALDVARALVELLEDALGGPTARVDLCELVNEAFQRAECGERPHAQVIAATVSCQDSGEVQANARVSTCLVSVGVRLAAAGVSGGSAHLSVGRSPAGALTATISNGAGEGECRDIVVPPAIGPLLECAQAAASATGMQFEREPGGAISIVWAPARD